MLKRKILGTIDWVQVHQGPPASDTGHTALGPLEAVCPVSLTGVPAVTGNEAMSKTAIYAFAIHHQ